MNNIITLPDSVWDNAIVREWSAQLARGLEASPESVAQQVAQNLYHILVERAKIIQKEMVDKLLVEQEQQP